MVAADAPGTSDFYCDEALSGRTPVEIVEETEAVLAFHHTRPAWTHHVVVIPKRHIESLLHLGDEDATLIVELFEVIRRVAAPVLDEHGACRVLTNLGDYQESRHLHFHVGNGELVEGQTAPVD